MNFQQGLMKPTSIDAGGELNPEPQLHEASVLPIGPLHSFDLALHEGKNRK
jgi:hypothetical protein